MSHMQAAKAGYERSRGGAANSTATIPRRPWKTLSRQTCCRISSILASKRPIRYTDVARWRVWAPTRRAQPATERTRRALQPPGHGLCHTFSRQPPGEWGDREQEVASEVREDERNGFLTGGFGESCQSE